MNVESPMANGEPSKDKESFQFGLRRLLILTAVCAGIAALAASIRAPTAFRAIVALYLIAFAIYTVLRVPFLSRGILRRTPRWKRLLQKRREIEAMVEQRKAELQRGDRQGDE
jgi:uncharacterized membrane protein YfcA